MILKPLVKSINEGWTPQHLFQGTDLGLWYDISDRSTLYQDSNGMTPVTDYGQPVGLILDKSMGAERKLIYSFDFENGLTGTSKSDGNGSVSTWELNTLDPISGTSDGKLTIITPPTTGNIRPILYLRTASTQVGSSIGYKYDLEFDYKVISGEITVAAINKGGPIEYINQKLATSGTFKSSVICIEATNNAGSTIYFGNTVGVVQIDNVRLYETAGHHASRASTTKRAIYARMPRVGIRNIIDNSDDFLKIGLNESFLKAGGRLDSDGGRNATIIASTGTGVPTVVVYNVEKSGAYTFTTYVKRHPSRSADVTFLVRNESKKENFNQLALNLTTGAITTGSGWTVEAADNGFFKIAYTTPSTIEAGNRLRMYFGATGNTSNTFGIILHKAQLEAGTSSTPHQTRVSEYDIYEQGQTHVDYLKFDGVDDWYAVSPTPILGNEETKSASTSELSGQCVILSHDRWGYLGFTVSGKKAFSYFSLDGSAGSHSNISGTKVGVMRKTPNLVTFTSEESKKDHAGTITGFSSHISTLGSFNSGSSSPTKGNIHQAFAISRFITDEETKLLTKYLGSKAGVTEYVES